MPRHRKILNRNTQSFPVVGLSLMLVALLWGAVLIQVESERRSEQQSLFQEAANIALAFEQNVMRTASEIDHIIKFLRRSHERAGPGADWASLVKDEYTVNAQTVQIAIIDANGMMVTSTAMLHPSSPVDLSDREHYRVHLRGHTDFLYISKPLIGRASGKWSVQFTRPFTNSDGGFAGVIVVSLDPTHLARAYGALDLGTQGGLALIGADDVIRAGTGVYANALGRGLQEHQGHEIMASSAMGTEMMVADVNGRAMTIASRVVSGYPLRVIVSARAAQDDHLWAARRVKYIAGAAIFTVLLVFGVIGYLVSRRRHKADLMHLLRHDALTGLSNRLAFRDELDRCLAGPDGFALLLVDLDNFKLANDTHGHAVGDKLLQEVAARLNTLKEPDTHCARLGGDELAVIQTRVTNVLQAEGLAKRICKALGEPYVIDGHRVVVGASIGMAFGAAGQDASDILKAADLALYEAKANGRGGYRVYDHAMIASTLARRMLSVQLAQAVEREEFELHYQPIVDAAEGTPTAFEALLRWRHPQSGLILPGDFIHLAEETGLILPIGRWVINRACRDIAALPAPIRVAVNVSPAQVKSDQLTSVVREALNKSGLAPDRLELEITETMLMEKKRDCFDELRAMGIQVALDDFGTGYSSLSYLQTYPIDSIKIDGSFIAKLGQIESTSMIVEAIAGLSVRLGMRTVAEGVETQQQLEAVQRLGCREVQGYFVAKPMPFGQVRSFLARSHSTQHGNGRSLRLVSS